MARLVIKYIQTLEIHGNYGPMHDPVEVQITRLFSQEYRAIYLCASFGSSKHHNPYSALLEAWTKFLCAIILGGTR
jgi:hypothetical protein